MTAPIEPGQEYPPGLYVDAEGRPLWVTGGRAGEPRWCNVPASARHGKLTRLVPLPTHDDLVYVLLDSGLCDTLTSEALAGRVIALLSGDTR